MELKLVDEDSFERVMEMEVAAEDKSFVAPNSRSLAEAWLYRENGDVFPHALYAEDTIVGFLLLEIDLDEGYFLIWRMMVAPEFQGLGHGRAAIEAVIARAKKTQGIREVRADYVKENQKMATLLGSMNFQIVGQDEREIWTRLTWL